MDAITQYRLAPLHPVLVARYTQLDSKCLERGINLRITQGLRTYAEQDALYAEGRTSAGVPCVHLGITRPVGTCDEHPFGLTVTEARGGYSAHNFGYALDAVPNDPNFPGWHPDWDKRDMRWSELLGSAQDCLLAEGAAWRTFPDAPHFYLQECMATPNDDMRAEYAAGGLPAAWTLINKLLPAQETT